MKTPLTPEQITALHAQGRAQAGPFVNPATIYQCKRVLAERGEDWAQSVLLRKLTRRSRIDPTFPWLEKAEDEILVLADQAEWEALVTP